MKIAFLGTRGIPASYSGFETCVEQLGQRLVKRGHEVTVYCRSHHNPFDKSIYKGMNLIKHGTIKNKYLETIVHSFISSIHSLFKKYDIALYFIAGNSPLTWIPRIVGTRTLLNVDGLDWKREKWPLLAKIYIQLAELIATKLPSAFITDSVVVQNYYKNRFKIEPVYIPYGSEVEIIIPGETLEKFDLKKDKYILFVGRLVPENCVHHLIDAFKNIQTDVKCVIVGDASYEEEYIKSLKQKSANDSRIIFTGYVFGKGYHELGSNSLIFIETSSVGGTHPALTEAMGFGNCIIVNNTKENLETIGDAGFSYNGKIGAESLRIVLETLLNSPRTISKYKEIARARANKYYSWERVTDDYENLFYKLLEK